VSLSVPAGFARQALVEEIDGEAAPDSGLEQAHALRAQVADAREFASFGKQWADLCARVAIPNVFMDPAVALAFAESWAAPVRVLLVWCSEGRTELAPRLVGAWLLVERVTRQSWPWTALVSPACPVAYLGTPVIEGEHAADVLAIMLEEIRKTPGLPKLVQAGDISDGSQITCALETVLAQGAGSARLIETRMRAKLVSGPDPGVFWAGSMSRQRLQGLSRKRRQLGKEGQLAFSAVDEPRAVAAALDDFLRLEASGWKGERHSALASDAATALFTVRMVAGLAQRRLVSIQSLSLDGVPVAMWVILYSGVAAYTWRTAFDESFGRFSPGILLLEDMTAHLLTQPGIAFTDSCNHRDVGHQAERWPDRHIVSDLLIDVASAGSARVLLLSWREIAIRACRRGARDLYHWLRGRLDGVVGRLRAFRSTLATRRSQ
jgi:hypothetical protein